jgi:ATP-dependent Clp protease ATP-binding subunit ClpC
MFERFTDPARRTVARAQEEARSFDHNYIGTEHLLAALSCEGRGAAARTLEPAGITVDAVRGKIETLIGRGQEPLAGHIPFTPQAKKVLELSLRESMQLGHEYIGTEHILLALIREGGGAAQLLARAGVDLDRARQQVVELLYGHREAGSAAAPPPAAADELTGRLISIVKRLDAIERRLRQSDAG